MPQSFFKDKIILANLAVSLLINGSIFVLVFFQTDNLAKVSALHYNIYFGIDVLGPWYKMFSLAVLGLVILFINFVVAYFIYIKENILSYLLVKGSTIVQILLLGITYFIISLNS